MRHFDSTPLRQEAISRSNSWRLSLEEARKEIMDKREKHVLERRDIVKRRAELMQLATKKSSVTVSSKTVQFAPTVCASVVETQSVASFVSVQGNESRDTLPTNTEAAPTGGSEKADKGDTSASRAQKSKSETLDFDKLSMGSNCSNSIQKRQQSASCRLKQQQLKQELESKRIKIQVEQYQRQKEEELRQLQEKIQLLELEDELRQCGGEIQKATVDGVDGCKVDDSAKDLGLDNNSVACSDAGSGFMVPIVSEADIRAHPPHDFHSAGSNDNIDKDGFDFSTLTIKAEETRRCSLFPPTSVGFPVKRLLGEFTPTYFQTRSLPTGNVKPATMTVVDQHGANEVTLSGRLVPKLKLREFAGDPLEWPEWSGMFQSTVGRSALSNNEKMRSLKALLTGAARRSVQGLGYSGAMFSVAWNTLERKFGQPHLIISAQLSQIQSYPTMRYQDSKILVEFADTVSNFEAVLQQLGYSNDLFSSSKLKIVTGKLPLDMRRNCFGNNEKPQKRVKPPRLMDLKT